MNFDPYLIPHTKNYTHYTDLNGKPKTIKFPEENVGKNFWELELGNDFLDHTKKRITKYW